MQINLPPALPVDVTFAIEELPWWSHWDFWVSFFTFTLACVTGWLAWETRGLRNDSRETGEAARMPHRRALTKRSSFRDFAPRLDDEVHYNLTRQPVVEMLDVTKTPGRRQHSKPIQH